LVFGVFSSGILEKIHSNSILNEHSKTWSMDFIIYFLKDKICFRSFDIIENLRVRHFFMRSDLFEKKACGLDNKSLINNQVNSEE